MIDFYFEIPLPVDPNLITRIIQSVGNYSNGSLFSDQVNIILPKEHDVFKKNNALYIILGDLIIPSKYNNKNTYYEDIFSRFNQDSLKELKGHFYIIEFNSNQNNINVYNSLFSIYPIYYIQKASTIYISSKIHLIKTHSNQIFEFNKRFILENVLFNYPIFDTTYLKEVFLLKSNSYLSIKDAFKIIKHTHIENYFVYNPVSWKKSRENIANCFIEQAVDYFPSQEFNIALTGGFDGRTLTSCALKEGKKEFINAFCFGNSESLDVKYSKQMAEIAGLNYNIYSLTEQYIKNESLKNGLEFIQNSEGHASFARAHYLYSAKFLSKKSKFLISGNFGSDVLRGFNVAGVMASPLLVTLFNNFDIDFIKNQFESSYEMSFLNKANFTAEKESLFEDIKTNPLFKDDYKNLTQNQIFYIFVFEEIFRKYFGPEMVNQAAYLYNRTPFLDFTFIKELLKTKLAGANQEFFVKNPIKRFRGQGLYPKILKKSYPDFSKIKTDNGYRPIDLINTVGLFNILIGYAKKKIKKIDKSIDPFAVKESYIYNKEYFRNIPIDENIFNKTKIEEQFDNPNRKETLFISLSQNWWKKQFNNPK